MPVHVIHSHPVAHRSLLVGYIHFPLDRRLDQIDLDCIHFARLHRTDRLFQLVPDRKDVPVTLRRKIVQYHERLVGQRLSHNLHLEYIQIAHHQSPGLSLLHPALDNLDWGRRLAQNLLDRNSLAPRQYKTVLLGKTLGHHQ